MVAMEGMMMAMEGLVVATEDLAVVAADTMEEKARALTVGRQDILQEIVLRLLVDGKRWNSTYSLFCTI